MRATVGRTVHFVEADPDDDTLKCRAATVTDVDLHPGVPLRPLPEHRELIPNEPVSLTVHHPQGTSYLLWVERCDAGDVPGTWHWPERVEED